MKQYSLATLLFFCIAFVHAQRFDFKQQTKWNETPDKIEVNKDFAKASAVCLLDDRTVEYKLEGKEIMLYTTYHRLYKINDDKGIEMFNKIYIPIYYGSTFTQLKARTILPSGKVKEVPDDKIKETEEDGRRYKLFAMEGVEKGAEIEYIYTSKTEPSYFGTEVFQSSVTPYQKTLFTLSIPQHLKFDVKGFNGFVISSDSVIGEQRVVVGYSVNIPEMDDEKYAVRSRYLQRVEYKLSYNLSANANVRIYTWKEYAKRAYASYTSSESKDEKPLEKLLSSINIDEAKNEESKIVAIEDYIKRTINIDKDLIGDDASELDKIIKRKSADNRGIIRLFANLFEKAGIKYQLVFVSRRDEMPLDEDLENWNRIDETAFYFPETKKYLSPTSIELRYPFIPFYWAGTKGLFLKVTTLGTFKSAIGTFGDIEMQPYQNSSHDMEATLKFSADMDSVIINSKQILTGYGAANYRPIYAFLPKEKQDDANLEIVKSVAKSTNIRNIKVENSLLTDFTDNKPLIISADITSGEMLEKAGNKILLKIGEIIGPQEEMYQEKPRQLPMELPYPHALKRTIVVEIPAGYVVKNLNDLNINIVHKDGDEQTMGFVSTYTQSGKKITINVVEDYRKVMYPLSQFEDFKKVINAAADFNKIVLVLEKEK